MQLRITNIYSIRIWVLCLIVKHHSETRAIKITLMKQSKGRNGNLKPEHKKTKKLGPRWTIHRVVKLTKLLVFLLYESIRIVPYFAV